MKKANHIHEIGIGLRPPHYDKFMGGRPSEVAWVEVISENFMNWTGRETPAARLRLEKIRRHSPVSLHGVSMNLGSADELSVPYMKALRDLIQQIDPFSVSDHLCWTGLNKKNSHDLLPLPYTEEALNHLTNKIHVVQDFLARPLAVENLSSYVQYKSSEMTEWDFLKELSRRSGCKLILDVNNIFVSSVNHGFDPLTYLRSIEPSSVEHIHLAGHTKKNGFLIDTHDQPVSPEVWELYRWTCQHIQGPKVMLERDDNIPEWQELQTELAIIRTIQEESIE